jgi:hypothetical protein
VGCLIGVLAAFAPRIALLLVWIFTPYVTRAFHNGFIWPFLGLLFVPFTTLMYSLVWVPGIGVTGVRWVWVVIGLVLDITWHSGSAYRSRR